MCNMIGIDSDCNLLSDQREKADFGHSKGVEYMKAAAAAATRGMGEYVGCRAIIS
jgi:hypothetical protein